MILLDNSVKQYLLFAAKKRFHRGKGFKIKQIVCRKGIKQHFIRYVKIIFLGDAVHLCQQPARFLSNYRLNDSDLMFRELLSRNDYVISIDFVQPGISSLQAKLIWRCDSVFSQLICKTALILNPF